MDVFDFDNVKAEKAKALRRYNRLRTVAKLFRLVEVCLVLVFLSWISTRLPFAVRISGEYFRRLVSVVVSPLFIFLISNAIVITLLAKSGRISDQTQAVDNAETDLYEEFVKTSPNGTENSPPLPEPVPIVFEDKEIISELKKITPTSNKVATAAARASESKTIRRSQSEKMNREGAEKPCGKLRRSATENCRKVVDSCGEAGEAANFVEELSNEEFQRAIEEFIAKQVKFHKEEKLAIVAC